jgi:hypothetical protein
MAQQLFINLTKKGNLMGVYDTVMVPCPDCGTENEFRSTSGDCILAIYELVNCPDDILIGVNRYAPNCCDDCEAVYYVDIPNRKAVLFVSKEPGPLPESPKKSSPLETITIRRDVLEAALDQLVRAQKDAFVQSTANVIGAIKQTLQQKLNDTFIVAEISKNWRNNSPPVDLLCQRFEKVINVNLERGYELQDWKLNVVALDDSLNETIIAIFKKIKPYSHD